MCWALAHKDEENVYFFDEIVLENTSTQQCIEEFIRRFPKHKSEIIINGDASGDNSITQKRFEQINKRIYSRAICNIMEKNGIK